MSSIVAAAVQRNAMKNTSRWKRDTSPAARKWHREQERKENLHAWKCDAKLVKKFDQLLIQLIGECRLDRGLRHSLVRRFPGCGARQPFQSDRVFRASWAAAASKRSGSRSTDVPSRPERPWTGEHRWMLPAPNPIAVSRRMLWPFV